MSQEIEITFYPIKISGRVPKEITILEAARRLGISVESPCGGAGKCGKDIVQVRINKTLDTVLACKTVVENDMEVTLPSQEKKDDMKIIDGFFTEDNRRDTWCALSVRTRLCSWVAQAPRSQVRSTCAGAQPSRKPPRLSVRPAATWELIPA
jgi:uncharacterized 2Fe-2S/4Fe-4S cluster protein (DUF4445 family)